MEINCPEVTEMRDGDTAERRCEDEFTNHCL